MIKLFSLKSEFTKNTAILVIGTIVAQSIPILLAPFLRRIYSTENFGAFALYLNILGIIIIFASLRYEAAIVLPKDERESANILSLSLILSFILCILLFLFFLFFNDFVCELINFPKAYSYYLYFLPLSAMLFSFYQSINFWLIRQKAFKASSINKISRRGVEGGVQFSSGFGNFSFGLVIGDFFGNLANAVSGINQMFKNNFKKEYITKNELLHVFKKYKEFPLFNLFPTLLSAAAILLPFIFISKLYSSTDVGYLDLSRLVLSIPLALLSATISQVILQQITEKKNNRISLKKDLLSVFFFLLIVAVAEIGIIFFCGPQIFGFVFGNKYNISGVYSQILVYSYVLNFIVSCFTAVFISLNRIKVYSVWQIVYFTGICCLLLLKNIALADFLKIYVAFDVIMFSLLMILIFLVVYNYEKRLKNGSK